eukprot:5550497-Prymnesium_polylepis.1
MLRCVGGVCARDAERESGERESTGMRQRGRVPSRFGCDAEQSSGAAAHVECAGRARGRLPPSHVCRVHRT